MLATYLQAIGVLLHRFDPEYRAQYSLFQSMANRIRNIELSFYNDCKILTRSLANFYYQ